MEYTKVRNPPKKGPKKRVRVLTYNPLTGRDNVSYVEIDKPRENGTPVPPPANFQSHVKNQGEPKIFTTESSYLDPNTNEWETEFKFRTVRMPKRTSPQSCVATPTQNPGAHSFEAQPGPANPELQIQEEIHPTQHRHQTDKSYACRRQKLSDAWLTVTPDLEKAFFESQAPSTFTCSLCQSHEDNIIFCPDCGPLAFFCKECAIKVHTQATFHIPLRWIENLYCTFMWTKNLKMPNHDCGTGICPTWIIIVDDKGREHPTLVHFCSCFSKAEALIRLGFWPGSPVNPQTAIDMRFMNQARMFLIEGAVAMQKFCASIREHQKCIPVYPTKIDLYRVLSQDCASIHRNFIERINNLQGVVPNYPDGSKCPLCTYTQESLPKVISLDGNFRLVRKASSGMSYRTPLHGSKFFVDQAEVRRYVEPNASTSTAHDNACSDFRAGDSKRSSFRSTKLDVSGIFGSICIHDYPQLFIDLDSGEKLGYAACIINNFKDTPAGLKVLYDIACRVKPKLERMGLPTNRISLAVPVFHGYAHQAKCQVEYNPRLLDNYRNADGENVERMWSYLGQFAYITREMTSANRRDLLVDAFLHYGRKMIVNAGARLKARFEAAKAQRHESWVQLGKAQKSLKDGGIVVTENTIEAWCSTLNHKLKRHSPSVPTWEENYVTILNGYFSHKARLVEPPVTQEEIATKADCTRYDEKLKKIEQLHKFQRWQPTSPVYKTHLLSAQNKKGQDLLKRMHREAIERRHLILIKRDARGYDSASRASKQLKLTNARIQKLLRQYNQLPTVQRLEFDAVKDTEAAIFQALDTPGHIPYGLMKEVVVAHNRINRCQEECAAIEVEFAALLHYHNVVHRTLEMALEEENVPVGVRAYIHYALLRNEEAQEEVKSCFIRTIPSELYMSLQTDTTFSVQVNAAKIALENAELQDEANNLVNENLYPGGLDDGYVDADDDDDEAIASSDDENFE